MIIISKIISKIKYKKYFSNIYMNIKNNQSIEDIIVFYFNNKNKKNKNINNKDNIFREYYKENDKFIAKNKFYISEDVENGIFIEFNSLNMEKIVPYSNKKDIYISTNKLNFENYINLILISNISFSLDDISINKHDLIKKIIENDAEINEKLFEDLYYNKDFSNKINLELPKKYNNKNIILEDIEIKKIYLFKINFIELNNNFEKENSFLL